MTGPRWEGFSSRKLFHDFWPLTKCNQPLYTGLEHAGRRREPEKMALVNQKIEFRQAVPTPVLVFEIHPKPDATFPVIEIDRAGIGGVRMGDKDYKGRGALEPSKNLRVFRKLQQLGRRLVQCRLWRQR